MLSPNNIPSTEPLLIFAGQTVQWTKSLSDYSSADYTLKYYLTSTVDTTKTQTVTGTAYNGTPDHLLSITSATSAAWVYGMYAWQCYAEKGAGASVEKWLIGTGKLLVKTATGESHAKKVLDDLEAVIEGKASQDILSYAIGGRSGQKLRPDELLKWRRNYQAEYQNEQAFENSVNGTSTNSKIRVRFKRP